MKNANAALAVSMGDPAGIGPELVWRAWLDHAPALAPLWVAAHPGVMRRAACVWGIDTDDTMRVVSNAQEANDFWATHDPATQGWPLVVVAVDAQEAVPAWAQVSGLAGAMAAHCIECAAQACLSGLAAAMVTAPIHKQALSQAGWDVPGHTELLQSLAAAHQGVSITEMPVRMMLANAELQTVLHTIHMSLREALDAVEPVGLAQTIAIAHRYTRPLSSGAATLRIAVAGVNPHAGEGGLFGQEEVDVIAPVVRAAQAQGMAVSGPHAPDTVFMRARAGEFDVVVAMYHDQGLIPVKYLGVDFGVNVTLGLPFIRTSPDHGTAMDLAGTGVASPESMVAAMRWARAHLRA
jgi:4-hydroxythreonine-4-phosphate dehydrogenase